MRRQFDAAARAVASSSAWVCTLCECLSVRAAETNAVQETVQRLSEEAANSLPQTSKIDKIGRWHNCKMHCVTVARKSSTRTPEPPEAPRLLDDFTQGYKMINNRN